MLHTRIPRSLFIGVLALFMGVFMTACDSDNGGIVDPGNGDDNGGVHEDAATVEVATRGGQEVTIAIWSEDDGWTDADGNAIDRLENPIETSAGDRLPLQAGGQNSSLTITFFNADGEEVDFSTVDRRDLTTDLPGANRQRECSEFSGRFFVLPDGQDKITWPPTTHPDGFDDPQADQFAQGRDGVYEAIFHCDHVHFYPERAGEFEVEFLLWHNDHSDDRTDPITVEVEEGNFAAERAEIATRGGAAPTIAIWTLEDGWTDADGNSIDRLEDPIETGAGDREPLRVGGQNASLTVSFFEDADGTTPIDIETVDRNDFDTNEEGASRERVCSAFSSRFNVTANTSAIAWPPIAHPDGFGADQFAQRADDSYEAIFHCDHVHFYPETEGEFDISFVLNEEADGNVLGTDPLTVEVLSEQ